MYLMLDLMPPPPIYKHLCIHKFNDIAKIQMCKLVYSYNIGSIPESLKSEMLLWLWTDRQTALGPSLELNKKLV